MAKNEKDPDFFRKINKVVNFFSRTSHGGFLFCSCDNTPLIGEITGIISERAGTKNLRIKALALSYDDGEHFLQEIKAAAEEKPQGIILTNLDEVIALTKDRIIKDINLARDILLGLNLPILFCVSTENIGKFANQAQDLFLRRARGIIHFPDVPAIDKMDIKDWIEEANLFGLGDLVDEKRKKLKLGLLESQLKEAEKKKFKPERIANEIALDLIKLNSDVFKNDRANELFKKYKSYFNLKDNVKAMTILGHFFIASNRLTEASDLYFKAENIQEITGDKIGLINTFHSIGLIYSINGELDNALEYLLKSKELCEKINIKDMLGIMLLQIARIYKAKGSTNKFIEYSIKAKEIFEKIEKQSVVDFINDKIKDAAAKSIKSPARK
jgi:tetratricopeptide (TPR) repeat protein